MQLVGPWRPTRAGPRIRFGASAVKGRGTGRRARGGPDAGAGRRKQDLNLHPVLTGTGPAT